ncbi:DUF1800 family protein [Bradyrhizobium sp. LHD-71]|uniref:DUF1800 domain-containing protein n=1 Tax=Bradyrhizobium sp. LHD-71 TaxID=3072141 RepID=UPI00280CEAC6|nr:DUF1800 family protein [Bradyrhizobium sp. LHD-71]MDQ8729065.1 DUF1800 family protein [Bradyrhizobium sp. LHD-71]
MARDPQGALVALNRFGFGARGGSSGDFASAAADPRGFVKAELTRPSAALLEQPSLRPSPEIGKAFFAYRADVRRQRAATKSAQSSPSEPQAQMANGAGSDANDGARRAGASDQMQQGGQVEPPQPGMVRPPEAAGREVPQPVDIVVKTYRAEALARFQRATLAENGFVERLVTFWSNHFCISASKGIAVRILAGAFEREAIRPHVLGRFSDMLLAVEQHPAMLLFLDNQQSLGPASRAGVNRKRGLNENLAREILELHTLGVGGGYTQQDVTSLARIITGWTFAGPDGRLADPGRFAFNVNAHEPGSQTLLGKSYPDTGLSQGQSALKDLGRHPSTAKFIATKLARHFVADDPPPALVARLAQRFVKTDGDLKALALELADADAAWKAPLTKIRTPYDAVIATGRMLARVPEQPVRYLGNLNLLGQPLWSPAGPNGFADTGSVWASPEGLKLRLDLAAQVGARLGDTFEPRELMEVIAGDATSKETRETIARAESRQQAMALLLMSPEFQRR